MLYIQLEIALGVRWVKDKATITKIKNHCNIVVSGQLHMFMYELNDQAETLIKQVCVEIWSEILI